MQFGKGYEGATEFGRRTETDWPERSVEIDVRAGPMEWARARASALARIFTNIRAHPAIFPWRLPEPELDECHGRAYRVWNGRATRRAAADGIDISSLVGISATCDRHGHEMVHLFFFFWSESSGKTE